MKLSLCFLTLTAFLLSTSLPLHPREKTDEFYKAIVYYLIKDLDQTKKYLDVYFRFNRQPSNMIGFTLLLANENWEATKKFNEYLESDYRSLEALIGISLATADMENSTSIENLNKALRVNPAYAAAYLCLGFEYTKRQNHSLAEQNYLKSIRFSKMPEGKILLCELYLHNGEAQKTYENIKEEADSHPGNYYFNLLTARACFQLNKMNEIQKYLDQALAMKPDSKDVLLLKGRYLLKINELKKAKAIFEKLSFDNYRSDYNIPFAETLVRLKDRNAEKYLYESFTQNKWDPLLNELFALHFRKKGDSSVQNWLNRALLAGMKKEELQMEFAASYVYPVYPFLSMFEIKRIQWLGNSLLLVAGKRKNGDNEELLAVSASGPPTIVQSFPYRGSIQDFFPSPGLDRCIFSTTAVENEKVYMYGFQLNGKNHIFRPLTAGPLKLVTVSAGFDPSGKTAYFTDGSIGAMAFESPFSSLAGYGKRVSIYPRFPFRVYTYGFSNGQLTEISGSRSLREAPIRDLQQYFQVADAFERNLDVGQLIRKGQQLEITASETVKIYFGKQTSSFIIYDADLKNAFQAVVYDALSNRAVKINETMFLGENKYAELDILSFEPGKKEILFLTRDKERTLILFNYGSLLYKKLENAVLKACYDKDSGKILVLSERNKFPYYSETNLGVISLNPYSKEKINSRKDLNEIIDCRGGGFYAFSTYNGETVRMDPEFRFISRGAAFDGILHVSSPDHRKIAAAINNRLYVLDWME